MLNERDSCETIEHISSERRMTEGRERDEFKILCYILLSSVKSSSSSSSSRKCQQQQ